MELQQLRYFVAVADMRNFTRAAATLHVAQPSLSQQIRKLERELGIALFERGPAQVRLTGEGAQFLPHARALLERLHDAEVAAAEIRGVQRGDVTLGISPIAGAHVLPRLLRVVRERLPGIVVRTREAGLGGLLALLEGGEVDLAMVLLPEADPRLVVAKLLEEDLVLVLPAGHRLAARDIIDLEAVRDEPFVLLTHEYGLRQRIEEECGSAGFAPLVVFESRDVGVVQALVEAVVGITILPASAVRADLRTCARPVRSRGRTPQREIGLAYRGDRYATLAARHVFALAQEIYGPSQR